MRRGLLICALAVLLLPTGLESTFSAWVSTTANGTNEVASADSGEPPYPNELPTIDGVTIDGETLTAVEGNWAGSEPITFSYQWERCVPGGDLCFDIEGATGSTYVLTSEDVWLTTDWYNGSVRVRVTGTNAYGQETARSEASDIIEALLPENVSPPTISGTPRENQVLTAGPGVWNGSTPLEFVYYWFRCDAAGENCAFITGAIGPTYTVGRDDLGMTIRVEADAYNQDLYNGGWNYGLSAPTAVATAISDSPEALFATNGTVSSIARLDGNTYIGGDFSLIGKPTGALAQISFSDGSASPTLPPVTGGDVLAMAPDGSGGYYIGGSFTHIGGVARNRLARILSNGTLDLTWTPNPDNTVHALAAQSGTLYVGGAFNTIASQTRNHVAAFTISNGAITAWNPNTGPTPSGYVYSLAPAGGTVYIGGGFTSVQGVARNNLAAVNNSTGAQVNTNLPSPNGPVYAIQSGPLLYVAGSFTTGNQISPSASISRNNALAISLPNTVANWNPNITGGPVRSMLVSSPRVYLGGDFTSVSGSTSHTKLAGVDVTSGLPTWNPPDPALTSGSASVRTLNLVSTTLYAGGDFLTVGGQSRRNLAAFDTNSVNGTLGSWAPQSSAPVYSSVQTANYVAGTRGGGSTTLMNVVERSNVAAFDADGAPTAWAPNASGSVQALRAAGGQIYAGGDFTTIGGQSRARLAALDPTTGAAESWNPGANGIVRALINVGSTLYVGGDFTLTGGGGTGSTTRNRLAAFAFSSATPNVWNPGANGPVHALLHLSNTVYVGGSFTTIGTSNTARNQAGAVATGNGAATTWNPNPNAIVRTLFSPPGSSTVYMGGDFTSVGTTPTARNRLAAFLTSATSTPTTWNPNANNSVWALHGNATVIWAGGAFNNIGGQVRFSAAGLRVSTGAATAWSPGVEAGTVRALVSDPSGIHIGGNYQRVGVLAPQGYAHFK